MNVKQFIVLLMAASTSACTLFKKSADTSSNVKRTTIIETDQFIVTRTPANEFSQKDTRIALSLTLDHIQKGLNKIAGSDPDLAKRITTLSQNKERVSNLVLEAGKIVDTERNTIPGFSLNNVLPSAFLIVIAPHAGLGAGGGVSGMMGVAFVIVPEKIVRVNKVTQQVSEFINLETSVAGIPIGISGGLAAGGGVGATVGVGGIWGTLESPHDFKGVYVGGVTGVSVGPVGGSVRLDALMRSGGGYIDNVFCLFAWEPGAEVKVELKGDSGIVADASSILQSFGLSASDGSTRHFEQIR